MKKVITIFILAFLLGLGYAGDTPKIEIKGKVTSGEQLLSGAEVTLYDENQEMVLQHRTTDSLGKYEVIEMEMGRIYVLEVKMKGHVVKRIVIDAKDRYYEEDAPPVTEMIIPFSLHKNKEVKKRRELKDKEFYIGKLIIDPATAGLMVDTEFSSAQKEKYETHLKKK